MYQTMDNVDGKQARRTGTSSGLGELFDHGIDSLNCTLASLLETAAMGLGCSGAGIFTALCPCLAMFFSTWETYHTHTLYLGYINGPTEGILIACVIMAISGVYGPQIWTQPMALLIGDLALFGFGPQTVELLGELTFRDIWITLILVSLFATQVPLCVLNVAKARKRKGLSMLPVFLEWIPMAVYTFGVGLWLYSPHSTLMRENHLVLFCVTMSFVFGRLTTKMILAHLTRQPFPYWTVMLLPLVGGAVLANLPAIGLPAVFNTTTETYYLWAYCTFACSAYFRWAYLVINAICDYLDINCFTIPHKKQVANQMSADAAKHGIANGKSRKNA